MVYEFLTNFPSVNYNSKSKLIRPQCRHDLNRLLVESKQLHPWALKMLDASSKPGGSQILNGNIHALGSISQCVNVGTDDSNGKDKSITGNYCIATFYVEPDQRILANETLRYLFNLAFSYNSIRSTYDKHDAGIMLSTNTISRGLCVPASCNFQDVFHLLESSFQEYNASGIIVRTRLEENSCHTKPELVELYSSTRIMTVVALVFLTGLLIIATVVDSLYKDRVNVMVAGKIGEPPKLFLRAFSLYRTWPQLWDTSFQPDEITCLHGIRFFGVILIYIQHKLIFGMFNMISNRTDVIMASAQKSSSPIRAFYNGVDIFVFLSACLTSYYGTRKLATHGKLNFTKMYLSRYIKLTPLVIGILWFVRNINAYPTGQYFRVGHFFSHACWDNSKVLMNLFYVQNSLSSLGEMCYPPTHSLATDMQQYLVAPFILTLLWKLRHNKMTLTLFSLATLLTLALYKGYTVYMNNLTTVSYFGVWVDDRRRSLNTLYISPIHQFTTYFLGLLLGAFLQSGKRIILNPFQKLIGWFLFYCCVYYSTFRLSHASLEGYEYNVMEQTEYSMVRPLLWSSALGYVIYMCHTGQAATLNRLLSWRYFVIFSKLSYAIYLTSVMTMVVFMTSVDNNFPFYSKLSMLIDLNEMGVIFASSVFFTLIFVMPLRDIAPLIMGEKPPGSTKKEETIRRTDEDEGRSEKDETSKEECEKMGFDYLQKIK
ncbi:hypothetical protein M8J76_003684 [Diaphorina citri]|nr:hypothetical protein M8J76_003684 [Diaphorina citri]